MKFFCLIGAGVLALSACSGGGDMKYAPGTASVTRVDVQQNETPGPKVVSKSDLERWDFVDVSANAQTLTPSVAKRALALPGAEFRRVADGFVISVPDTPLFTHPNTRINPGAMPYMTRLAAALLKDPSVRLDVIAHYHYDGENQKALLQSERRAVAVQAALLSRSVPVSRVRAIGAGDRSPIVSNATPLGQSQNRRIEFHFRKG